MQLTLKLGNGEHRAITAFDQRFSLKLDKTHMSVSDIVQI